MRYALTSYWEVPGFVLTVLHRKLATVDAAENFAKTLLSLNLSDGCLWLSFSDGALIMVDDAVDLRISVMPPSLPSTPWFADDISLAEFAAGVGGREPPLLTDWNIRPMSIEPEFETA